MLEKVKQKIVCNHVYISSGDKNGGIYRYSLDNEGTLAFKDKSQADSVMYTVIEGKVMYAILKEPFQDSKESGLTSYTIDSDGRLIPGGNIIPTGGEEACHLAVGIPEKRIYCANYTSGSVSRSDGLIVLHTGNGSDKVRQDAPHTHCTVFTPDGRYLCVADLGIDKILVYDKELIFVSQCALLPGSGPRHLVFAPNGKDAFCVNELSSTVSMLEYSDGKLEYRDSFSTLPKGYGGESYSAAIRISADGKNLYASNRGHDSIACFKVYNNYIDLFDIVPTGGSYPRDFNISPDGKWLVCANEKGNNVTTFSIRENGSLARTDFVAELKSPLCVTFYTAD